MAGEAVAAVAVAVQLTAQTVEMVAKVEMVIV
jgi:hypothetical protein